MKRIAVLLLLTGILTTNILQGQSFLKGRISDSETGQMLAGANIQVLSTGVGTSSDEYGLFQIVMPETKTQIKVSYLGYSSEVFNINPKSFGRVLDIKLIPILISSDAIVVTATKSKNLVSEVPGRTELLSIRHLESIPIVQADDFLRTVAGVVVNREHGILDHSSTVSLRGLGGDQQGRCLVLYDGIPMNKADGGSVNWNSINTEDVSRIEIAKGPGSSLYGGNAMGGVINYISKTPVEPFKGSVQLEYGSLNTVRGKFFLGGSAKTPEKGLYWSVQGFGNQSDGYIQVPELDRDSTVVANYLKEWGGAFKLGYRFNNNRNLEIKTGYWWDRRGSGTKIFEETGTFFSHNVSDNSIHYSGKAGRYGWSALGYFIGEDYSRLNESIKASGSSYSYTSYTVSSRRNDAGVQVYTDYKLKWNLVSLGADLKQGSVFGQDIYSTSTDIVTNQGKIRNFAIYLQNQITLVENSLHLVAGIRWDQSKFFDGGFFITNPTSATSILSKLQNLQLEQNVWSEFSPKLALKYATSVGLSAYASYGHGFRPSILDDMCRSGFIRGGFKRANPYLGPESLNNLEVGGDILMAKKVNLAISSYYSFGTDFIYLTSTGDSILQGNKPKPLIEAHNISGVRIFGIESALKANLVKDLSAFVNYAYINSIITNYNPEVGLSNLKGKTLIYVPTHQLSSGFIWRTRFVSASVQCSWLSRQWMDDLNTIAIPSHLKIDTRIWTDISNLRVFINGQNLNNAVYLEGHGLTSLGRFISGGVSYRF
jgi:iron complex outermembrane recepter protein